MTEDKADEKESGQDFVQKINRMGQSRIPLQCTDAKKKTQNKQTLKKKH